MCIAIDNVFKGLNKIQINQDVIQHDLHDNHIVVTEGIQTMLRKEGQTDAYETIKALIESGQINNTLADYDISPEKYIGYASNIK